MPRTDPIEAVIVDDSHFMRTVIADALESGPIEVVATAGDGEAAVSAAVTHGPDVVTMDVEMPGVGGLTAVSRIMATAPTPILMRSAHTDDAAAVSFEAIERGAVDVLTKPGGERSIGMGRFEAALRRTVLAVARASAPSRTAGRADREPATGAIPMADHRGATVVIGASTGGPHAVERLLATLPAAAALRVLVVQHLPEGITDRVEARVDRRSAYAVREACDGTDEATGVRRVRHAGGVVIAQDESTSAVFGMPRRAIDTGYVDRVLPLRELPAGILGAITRRTPA